MSQRTESREDGDAASERRPNPTIVDASLIDIPSCAVFGAFGLATAAILVL
jgi:hypothetical protein